MGRLARPGFSDSRAGAWPASFQDYLSFGAVKEFSSGIPKKKLAPPRLDFTSREAVKNTILGMCGSPALVNLFFCRLEAEKKNPADLFKRFSRWLDGYTLKINEPKWRGYRARWIARRAAEKKAEERGRLHV